MINVGNVNHVNYIQVLNRTLPSFELDLECKISYTRCSEPEFRACLRESSQGVSGKLHGVNVFDPRKLEPKTQRAVRLGRTHRY